MTNNTDNLTAARDTINRQIEATYGLISAEKAIIKANAFLGTEQAARDIADSKLALAKLEGRVAGLIFARDEVFLPRA